MSGSYHGYVTVYCTASSLAHLVSRFVIANAGVKQHTLRSWQAESTQLRVKGGFNAVRGPIPAVSIQDYCLTSSGPVWEKRGLEQPYWGSIQASMESPRATEITTLSTLQLAESI